MAVTKKSIKTFNTFLFEFDLEYFLFLYLYLLCNAALVNCIQYSWLSLRDVQFMEMPKKSCCKTTVESSYVLQ